MPHSVEEAARMIDAVHRGARDDHRVGLIVSGSASSVVSLVQAILKYGQFERHIWFGDPPVGHPTGSVFPLNQTRRFLGSEYDLAVLQCFDPLDPDAVGVVSGLVRGGGVLILIRDRASSESLYTQRFWKVLRHRGFLDVDEPVDNLINALETSSVAGPLQRVRTPDYTSQKRAIELIAALAKQASPAPLVLTADRGRGKTSALGLAARRLIDDERCRILLVAPSRATIKPFLTHGEFQVLDDHDALRFRVPAQCALDLPDDVDLCLVDEAAALPVQLLIQLTKRYGRIVFSSTTQGYEGSGQGFAIRFFSFLDQWAPDWTSIHLNIPIRWSLGDPVEDAVQAALCLDASLPILPPHASDTTPAIYRIAQSELLLDEEKLYEIFGLLVGAHYRTVPSDLMRFMDVPMNEIWVAEDAGRVVGALIGSWEGGLDRALAEDMVAGRRRPHGHFIPGVLSAHLGILEGAQIRSYRIQRIAVHPNYQRQGIGQAMIKEVRGHACDGGAGLLGTSFGATHSLVCFWQSCGFEMLRLGIQRGRSTGEFSALMGHSLDSQGASIQRLAVDRFLSTVFEHISEAWTHLDLSMVALMSVHLAEAGRLEPFNGAEQNMMNSYLAGHVEMASVRGLLNRLVWRSLSESPIGVEDPIIIELVRILLQGWSPKALNRTRKESEHDGVHSLIKALYRREVSGIVPG